MNTKIRLPTYVTPQYRDDRKTVRSSRSNDRIDLQFQRDGKSRDTNVAPMNSQGELTKRKLRRGHFQTDDADSWEVTLDTIKHRFNNPAKTISSINANVKEIGAWCPNCFKLGKFRGDSWIKHEAECKEKLENNGNSLSLLKNKFRGFWETLNDYYDKAVADNKALKRRNFFDTGILIYLKNIIDVTNQIYNLFEDKFLKWKHLDVFLKKINMIFKEVWDKSQDYNYVFTLALRGKELITEYLTEEHNI
jgi:hypothetical protein